MREVVIHSAWHITQVAYYLLGLVKEKREPVQCRFQDLIIQIIPDEQEDTVIKPEWKERLIPENEMTSI